MTTVLVTGGTGCIGSNLAARLVESGHRVRILRRETSDLRAIAGVEVEHYIGDVRDQESIQTAARGCDVIFHTAAIVSFSRKRRALQHEVNVSGTRNVVNACLGAGVRRLVHTSSVAAVGYAGSGALATEEVAYNWGEAHGYRYSKHLSELEILDGVRHGLDAVIVNPSVVVGERDIYFHGGQIIRDIRSGRIPFYVDGGMNIVYTGDVVKGHILAAEKGRVGERYILAGENLTHKEIFERTADLVHGKRPMGKLPLGVLKIAASAIEGLSSLMGVEPLITRELALNAGRLNWFSSAKAERELGYTASSFDHAINAAYRWYLEKGFL